MQRGACDVEAGDDVFVLVEKAVAIGVFEDGDLVRAFFTTRRRKRDFVELRTQVLVVADDFQSGGELVLAIHGDPHAAFAVPAHIKWLLHIWLGSHEVDDDVAARFELLHGLRSGRGRRVIAHHAAAWACLHDFFHGVIAGDVVGFDVRISGEGRGAEREKEKTRFHIGRNKPAQRDHFLLTYHGLRYFRGDEKIDTHADFRFITFSNPRAPWLTPIPK